MLETLFSAAGLASLLTLVVMEIVLGIDNIIFISILCGGLPQTDQKKVRNIGLMLALVMRICLLLAITLIIKSDKPLFTLFDIHFSIKDIILLCGGLFLIYKSTAEIHAKTEGEDEEENGKKGSLGIPAAIAQIIMLDLVFSFDSILTAVGMVDADKVIIMIAAVIVSMVVMLFFSGAVSDFVNNHPGIKMLALAFLLMIGTLLVAEGLQFHVPKGYVYFSMTFALFVELLKMRSTKNTTPHKK